MKENNPVITPEISAVISELQQRNGVAEMYVNAVSRIFNHVLYHQDDMGMSDREAIATLRVLAMIREDIVTLSRIAAPVDDDPEDPGTEDEE